MKPLTLKLIDKQGVGTSSEYLALCRGEGDSLSNATLGEGTTARAAYAEAMNAWFTRQRESVEAALERARVTEPPQHWSSGGSASKPDEPVSEPIIAGRTATSFRAMRDLLEEAARGNHLVDIVYQGERDDEPVERQITPLSTFTRASASAPFSGKPENTYVTALDRRSGESRQFRLDRMTRAELVG